MLAVSIKDGGGLQSSLFTSRRPRCLAWVSCWRSSLYSVSGMPASLQASRSASAVLLVFPCSVVAGRDKKAPMRFGKREASPDYWREADQDYWVYSPSQQQRQQLQGELRQQAAQHPSPAQVRG